MPVTDSHFGEQKAWISRVAFDFRSQLSHINAQIMSVLDVLRAPHISQQLTMGHDITGTVGQPRQQLELYRGQAHLAIGIPNAVSVEIDEQTVQLVGSRLHATAKAQRNSNARPQLSNAKRLGDVVVCTGIESFNLAAFVRTGRKDQNGYG